MLICLLFLGVQAQKTAKISAVANGYTGKVIDFEFVDNPANNMNFPYADNKRMEFEVELKEPSLLKINIWLWVMVCPGDEIDLNILYEGKNYKSVEFRGTPSAVKLNEVIRDGRTNRVQNRYKTNPLAAVVTQVPVADYYTTTLNYWKYEQNLLETIKDEVNPFAYNYILAELEGMYLSNLVRYPLIYADVMKKTLNDCLPTDYWSVLDNYKLKDDKATLKSFSYVGWLLTYKEYVNMREAHKKGEKYQLTMNLQTAFNQIVDFYEGNVRDAALYALLYNSISGQNQDFDQIAKLSKIYFKKYNKNKAYKKELSEMQK